MAYTDPRLALWFENSNGKLYELSFDLTTGAGWAKLHGDSVQSSPQHGTTKVALTVDGASLSAWQSYHNSRRCYAAVYNTAQDLDTILNAS